MILHTARLFIDGPVRRVLDIAATVRESEGALDLDTELRRFIRMTRLTRASDWVCPIATVNALLDHAARLCAEGGEELPGQFERLLRQAGAGKDAAAFLHSLASRLRALEQDPGEDYDVLPLSRWEIELRFPHLRGFGVNWMDDACDTTLEECIRAGITSEHPYCAEWLVPLTAEAQSALVLFPGEAEMKEHLRPLAGWATHRTLRQLLSAVHEHMRQEHARVSGH